MMKQAVEEPVLVTRTREDDFFAGFPGIDNCTPEQQTQLINWIQLHHFSSGNIIIRQGEPANSLYIIKSGEVEFFTRDAAGEEIVLRIMGAGAFFGEAALLEDAMRSADARVPLESDASLWEVPRAHLEDFLRLHPDYAIMLLKQTVDRMISASSHIRNTVRPVIARQIEEDRTPSERVVQKLVHFIGSVPFLAINLALCLIWIVLVRVFRYPWDTDQLPYLALLLGIEALVMTVLVLTKQNRDEEDANIRTDTLLKKSDNTEKEIRYLREMVDTLVAERHRTK